jgi:hypothetical protein
VNHGSFITSDGGEEESLKFHIFRGRKRSKSDNFLFFKKEEKLNFDLSSGGFIFS